MSYIFKATNDNRLVVSQCRPRKGLLIDGVHIKILPHVPFSHVLPEYRC
jgi:hypothetical protein